MDPVTHVAAGITIVRLIPTPVRKWGILAGVAFALLPDVDFLLAFVDRLAFIRHHRGFTHSLAALGLFTFLGAWIGRRLGGARWFRPLILIGLSVLGSHLLLDLATSYGTRILTPFSREKFTLNWLFIIDPYLTLILLVGAFGAVLFPARERRLTALSLALAGVYMVLCGLYHHQALALGRRILTGPETVSVAALPQPFSCRRWHLLAVAPAEVRQTMVQLPLWGFLTSPERVEITEQIWKPGANPHAPPLPYQPPLHLLVHKWSAPALPLRGHAPETERLLHTFLEFARFPLLTDWQFRQDGLFVRMLDLRFTVPGRAFPYVLELSVAKDGRLLDWRLGHPGFRGK